MFERYASVSQADIADAIGKLEVRDGHSLGHSEDDEDEDTPPTRKLGKVLSRIVLRLGAGRGSTFP